MKELDSTEAPACNEEELLAWNKIETKKQNEMFAGLLEADKHIIQNVWIDKYYIIIKFLKKYGKQRNTIRTHSIRGSQTLIEVCRCRWLNKDPSFHRYSRLWKNQGPGCCQWKTASSSWGYQLHFPRLRSWSAWMVWPAYLGVRQSCCRMYDCDWLSFWGTLTEHVVGVLKSIPGWQNGNNEWSLQILSK